VKSRCSLSVRSARFRTVFNRTTPHDTAGSDVVGRGRPISVRDAEPGPRIRIAVMLPRPVIQETEAE
jgi:hypothetical protein